MRALMLLPLLLCACAGPGQLGLTREGSAGSGVAVSSRISARLKEKLAGKTATDEVPTAAEAPEETPEEATTAEEAPEETTPAVVPEKGSKRKVQPYRLSLVRGKKRLDNVLLIEVDPNDPQRMWISKAGRKRVTDFLADEKHDLEKRVPERLLWYLYLVGQSFDSPIHVLSAYRSKERNGSRHAHGQAVDFRIPGVDPKDIWNALKRFDHVGLGWYPKSKFVHLDVREKSAYWIDDSGPGQRARYRKGVPQDREKRPRIARAQ